MKINDYIDVYNGEFEMMPPYFSKLSKTAQNSFPQFSYVCYSMRITELRKICFAEY